MILALDTATRSIGLALTTETEVLAEHSWRTPDHHTVELAPAIQSMLHSAGVTPGDLRAVAVALGPGSFTGLRIGLGLAKGLALARSLALVGVPTLDIVARAQPPFEGLLLAVLLAGRGRIARAEYRWTDQGWQAPTPAEITTWEDLCAALQPDTRYQVCGEVDEAGRALLKRRIEIAPPTRNVRRAACLADIARARLAEGRADDPRTLVPVYMQQPTITPPRTQPEPTTA